MRPRRAARTRTLLAVDRHPQVERLACAEHDLVEGELEHDLGIGSLRRPRLAARARPAAEDVAVEERIEQVVQAELIGTERRAGARARARAFRAEHVVAAATLGVAQRLVRLVELLESLDRLRVVAVGVGVVLARERAKGLLDLVLGRVRGHAEDLVVVPAHRESCRPSCCDTVTTAACALR